MHLFALWCILTLFQTLSYSRIISVDHDDPSIEYFPRTCDLDCHRVCRHEWWKTCEPTDVHRTKGENTRVTFFFTGSSITWHSVASSNGGRATVYLDGDRNSAQQVNARTPAPGPWRAYSRSGLDPRQQHFITIEYNPDPDWEDNEKPIDIARFEYDDGAEILAGTTTSTRSPTTTTISTPPPTEVTRTNTITSTVTTSTNANTETRTTTRSGGVLTVSETTSLGGSTATDSRELTITDTGQPNVILTIGDDGRTTTIIEDSEISEPDDEPNGPPIAAIVGGVLGSVAFLLLGLGLFCLWKRKQRKPWPKLASQKPGLPQPFEGGFGVPQAIMLDESPSPSVAYRTTYRRTKAEMAFGSLDSPVTTDPPFSSGLPVFESEVNTGTYQETSSNAEGSFFDHRVSVGLTSPLTPPPRYPSSLYPH